MCDMRGQQLLGKVASETMAGLVARPQTPAVEMARSEDLRLRNFDDTSHHVAITVRDHRGTDSFAEDYHLPGNATASVLNELDDGVYEVTVTVDDRKTTTATCQVGDWPDQTIRIELGNGIVNVATND